MRTSACLLFAIVASTASALAWATESPTSSASRLKLLPPAAKVSYRTSMTPSAMMPSYAAAPYQDAIGPMFAGPRPVTATSRWISAAAVLALEATGNLRSAPSDNAYSARDTGSRTATLPQHTDAPAGDFAGWIR
jgi:hypothetical protein